MDLNISQGSCAREPSAKRALRVAMMPNHELARSFPLLRLRPSVDQSYEVHYFTNESHRLRKDGIPPSLKTSVFSEKRASVREGHFWTREAGGGAQTCAAAARPPPHWSRGARPQHGPSGHQAPSSPIASPHGLHLGSAVRPRLTDTGLHERTPGEEGKETRSLGPEKQVPGGPHPRALLQLRGAQHGAEPQTSASDQHRNPALSRDAFFRNRNLLGARAREQDLKPETRGSPGTTCRGPWGSGGPLAPGRGRLQLPGSQTKQQAKENRQQLIGAAQELVSLTGHTRPCLHSVTVNTGTVRFLGGEQLEWTQCNSSHACFLYSARNTWTRARFGAASQPCPSHAAERHLAMKRPEALTTLRRGRTAERSR